MKTCKLERKLHQSREICHPHCKLSRIEVTVSSESPHWQEARCKRDNSNTPWYPRPFDRSHHHRRFTFASKHRTQEMSTYYEGQSPTQILLSYCPPHRSPGSLACRPERRSRVQKARVHVFSTLRTLLTLPRTVRRTHFSLSQRPSRSPVSSLSPARTHSQRPYRRLSSGSGQHVAASETAHPCSHRRPDARVVRSRATVGNVGPCSAIPQYVERERVSRWSFAGIRPRLMSRYARPSKLFMVRLLYTSVW